MEMSSKKAKGTVRWFNTTRSTGFVILDHGNGYIFFKSCGDQDLNIGDSVEFKVRADWRGRPRAFDIMASALTSDSHPDGCDAGGGGPSYDGDHDFHHGGGCGHNGDGAGCCYISGKEVDALRMWSEGTALPVSDETLPSAIFWDQQIEHNVSTSGGLLDLLACGEEQGSVVLDVPCVFDGLSSQVVWDEELPVDFDSHSLMKQLVSEMECCPQARTKLCFPKNSEARDGLEREVAPAMVDTPAPSSRLGMATSAPAHEIFTEISTENVTWGEEVMADHDTDNCLQLNISDKGRLDSEKAERMMEFDDVGSIIWDKDVPHILDMHINALEQFTSVKQAVLMAPIMPNGDVEGLLSEVYSQMVSMSSFYSEDATYSAFDEVPLLDVAWDAMSADADEGFKVVWDAEAPCGENAKLT
jgi:cold shock CspA family protein